LRSATIFGSMVGLRHLREARARRPVALKSFGTPSADRATPEQNASARLGSPRSPNLFVIEPAPAGCFPGGWRPCRAL